MSKRGNRTIAVIGGGLQGVGLALELSLRGLEVVLFEKREECLTQASLHNEGKVHLGFVYANDPSLQTARLMSHGAFRFAPVVWRWLESAAPVKTSDPFHYVVHRESLLSPQSLESIYRRIEATHRDCGTVADNHYFGKKSLRAMRRLSEAECEALVDPSAVLGVFESPELAVDPPLLCEALRERLQDDPKITVHARAAVQEVEPDSDSVGLTVEADGERSRRRFAHVINAAWEDLVYLDSTAGVAPRGRWNFRAKHFLRGHVDGVSRGCPSATIVLGAFGDVVHFGDGDLYLSWYPAGRRRWTHALRPDGSTAVLAPEERAAVRHGTWEALARIFPQSLGRADPGSAEMKVNGGIILALGASDIENASSQLHERKLIGPRSFGRYHSVDTGKLTTAPLFAETLAREIAAAVRG